MHNSVIVEDLQQLSLSTSDTYFALDDLKDGSDFGL